MKRPKTLESWHGMIKSGDQTLLDELLHDDVVFHSPVVWKPQRGRALAKMYLMAAAHILGGEGFEYTREVFDDHHYILEFTKDVEGITINGVDMIEVDKEGKIIDFKVMVRPLKAMSKIHEKMGELLKKMPPISV